MQEALIIADGLENVNERRLELNALVCLRCYRALWKEDGNSLRKIYSAFGKRSGYFQRVEKYDLFEWFRGDLST